MKPDIIAIPRITNKKAAIILFLKIDLRRITSVRLAPALPMINAITAPSPIPLVTSAALKGITASALIYRGIPITAAIGIDNMLSLLEYLAMNSVGINP